MANNWNEMDATQQERVQARFLARNEAREIASSLPQISVATLYRYARNKGTDSNGAIAQALENDTETWDEFLKVLDLVNVRELGQLAAASSEAGLRGGWDENRQWRYQVRQAPEPPYEEVLIIEMVETAQTPTRILAESASLGQKVDLQLEAPFRGSIQMLLAQGDTLANILSAEDRIVRMW